MMKNPLLIILGATASGKTKLAVQLADVLKGEVISADSRQVYQGMDIGTGKDLGEYHINGKCIPYHLIDILKPGQTYNVNAYKEDFYSVFEALSLKGILPVLCGGTGMYVHSILQKHQYTSIPVDSNLRSVLLLKDAAELRTVLSAFPNHITKHADQSSHKRLIRAIEIAEFLKNHQMPEISRPEISPFIIGLYSTVETRRARILKRLNQRFEEGMIAEVQQLLDAGVSEEMLTFYGLEYKLITAHLLGKLNYVELLERLSIAICQFAKRQMTFFRKMEKDGIMIHWMDTEADSDVLFDEALTAFTNWKKD